MSSLFISPFNIYIILVNTPAKMTIIQFLILLFQNSVQLQTLILSSQNQLGQVSLPLLLLKDYWLLMLCNFSWSDKYVIPRSPCRPFVTCEYVSQTSSNTLFVEIKIRSGNLRHHSRHEKYHLFTVASKVPLQALVPQKQRAKEWCFNQRGKGDTTKNF